MNNKIIGFTITLQPIDHSDIDIFGSGLKLIEKKHAGLYLYAWGIGDLQQCYVNPAQFSLSFPLKNTLYDRNVLITLTNQGVIIENDWLGSIPIFYNASTLCVSTLVNKVINSTTIKIDSEGLNNYLAFGYSVFDKTPVKGVKFLRYFSKLIIHRSQLLVKYKADCISNNDFLTKTEPNAVLQQIEDYVHNCEKNIKGNIVIPTSGGFDSRLLNISVNDKTRIRAFTYGISLKQSESDEVVKAKYVTTALNVRWERIELGYFNKYSEDWFKLYGCAVHLHGMYHIEFFHHICQLITRPASLLSGIFGDVWSGKVVVPSVPTIEDLPKLSYAHNLCINPKVSLLTSKYESREKFLQDKHDLLQNHRYCIITTIRLKIILISYLMSLPDYFGFASWTPFLNKKNALGMLNLPDQEKKDRLWQRRYFVKNHVDAERQHLVFTQDNLLDRIGLQLNPIEPIDVTLLSPYIKNHFLTQTNKAYINLLKRGPRYKSFKDQLLKKRYIGIWLINLGMRHSNYILPYNKIAVLKSIELLLRSKKLHD